MVPEKELGSSLAPALLAALLMYCMLKEHRGVSVKA